MKIAHACLLALVTGMSPAAPTQDATPVDTTPAPLTGGLTLGEFLQHAREILDIDAFVGVSEDDLSISLRIVGTPAVPKSEFLPFFEKVLRDNGYLHAETRTGNRTVHMVRGKSPSGRGTAVLKTLAPVLTPEQVEELRHRATLVTTVYRTQHLSARDAVNTLQPYFANNFTDNIRSIEGTSAIVMTGFSDTVAGILTLLRSIDKEPIQTQRQLRLEQRIEKLEAVVATLQEKLDQQER